ncbi:MAG: carboxypeptidase regulatory-like domain-containing protein [Archangium sp.]
MKRVVSVTVVLILASAIGFWLWSRTPVTVPQPRMPLDEQRALVRESKWTAPIAPRGERTLSGIVTRNGAPAGGIVVTALATQGVETLATTPCQSEDGPDEKLNGYRCDERLTQVADWVASRAGEAVPLARTTTELDGTFQLQGLDDSVLTVWADGEGFVAVRENVTRDETKLNLELQLAHYIEGTVKRFDKASPKGILVTAVSDERARFYEVVLDDQGAFKLGPMAEGHFTVVAMHEDLMPELADVMQAGDRKLEFELSAPRMMSGVVLDGDPVSGAKVRIDSRGHKREVVTAGDGTFTFKRISSGRYQVYAESKDAIGTAEVMVGSSEDQSGVTIELQRGEPMSGSVTDEKGNPIPDVEVSMYDGEEWHKLKSDAEGHFALAVVRPGEHSFTARKRGYFAKTIDTTERDVKLVLKSAVNITGRVETAPGVLLKEFTIVAESMDAFAERDEDAMDEIETDGIADNTDSKDGTFSLDVKPGKFTLRVDAEGYAVTTLEPVVAPSSDVVVTMKRGARLSGQVLGFDGVPAKDVDVLAPGVAPKRTDEQGRFAFEGLTPRGEDDIVSAMARFESGMPLWSVEKKVTLKEGELTTVTLQPVKGVKVAGVVLDWSGKPVPKAEVTAVSFEGESRAIGGAATDTEGRFVIDTLPAGKAQVSVMVERMRAAKPITAPDDRIVLKLKRETTISGRVIDDTGAPVKAFRAGRQPFDTLDGKFEVNANKGNNELLFEATGFAPRSLTFVAKEGPNEVPDVKLTRGRSVSGVVLDEATRNPIPNATVDVIAGEVPANNVLSEVSSTKTDPQGRYRLQRVDPEVTQLVVTHPDYLMTIVPLAPSATKQDVTVKAGGVVIARVMDVKGTLLPRVGLQAVKGRDVKNFNAAPSNDGSQLAKGLAPGKWVLMVRYDRKRVWRPLEIDVAGSGTVNVELREATDGIDVKVKVDGGDERGMALVSGDKTALSDMAQLIDEWNLIEVRDGVAQKVPSGKWTLLVVRESKTGSKLEISSQLVDVPGSGEFSIVHSPKWRPVTGQPLFRSNDDDEE